MSPDSVASTSNARPLLRPVGAVTSRRADKVAAFLVLLLAVIACTPVSSVAQSVKAGFVVETITSDFTRAPVGFAFLPDERMFVIHHQSGRVDLVVNGLRKSDPLLVVDSLQTSSEEGLLGIAIDPDFPDSNYVYLFHTKTDSTNQVSRFTVTGALADPDSDQLAIDPASQRKIFSEPNLTRFHNGGTLRFGSDKTLYLSMGDDAYADSVQSLTNRNGKILRFNRDGTPAADNPVYPNEPADRLPEVFAMGLRNPYRFTLDPLTDQLFIGDVGTNLYEEFNLAVGGENFGYPHYEGPDFFRDYVPLIPPEPTFPIYYYAQWSRGRSALALATYRPSGSPNNVDFPAAFDGVHIFTDFFDSEIRYLRANGESGYTIDTLGTGFSQLTDGAVASDGSLYVLSYGGKLFRIYYDGNHTAIEDNDLAGRSLRVSPNFPEPFVGRTTIEVSLAIPVVRLRVSVYNLLGREVRQVFDGPASPGNLTYEVDLTDMPAGVYVLRAETGSSSSAEMLTLISH